MLERRVHVHLVGGIPMSIIWCYGWLCPIMGDTKNDKLNCVFSHPWDVFLNTSKYAFGRLMSFVNRQLKKTDCSNDHGPYTILFFCVFQTEWKLACPGYCIYCWNPNSVIFAGYIPFLSRYGMIWPWLKNLDPKLDTQDYTYLKTMLI